MEFPRYQCHKIVQALQIQSIDPDPASSAVVEAARVLTFVEPGYPPVRVEADYMQRHRPQAGGYYVVYEPDGYVSFSPAAVFEAGYTRIADNDKE